ncbi:MAG: hypothetical protein GF383_05395 [Candidatus Lokiarchaeota archaeon]|nr:hypothetical protein [Candidatus Lokiarchaeota archaeon]MBD3339331.1 hypothetical protein [Candidatus Lokiarchaeota archaeon]
MVIEKKSRVWSVLLIGTLSMFFAEIFSGASLIWIIDPWSLLVTYPLYLAHLLLLLNISMRMKKTSIPQLYLFGVIFGLYESWITKVLWSGYPGSEAPILGLVAGIAVVEFIVLVFFWHPFMAFIIPIITYESLALSKMENLSESQDLLFKSHLPYLEKNSKFYYFIVVMVLLGAAFLSVNSGYNIVIAVIAASSSVILIYMLYRFSDKLTVHSLRFGKKGMTILIIYIVALYLFTFFSLMPENIPQSPVPILIIVGFYGITIALIYLSKPVDIPQEPFKGEESRVIVELYGIRDMFILFVIFTVLTIPYCLLPLLSIVLFAIFTYALIFVGPIIFIYFSIKALRGKG